MKNLYAIVLVTLLIALTLAGCAQPAPSPAPSPAPVPAPEKPSWPKLTFGVPPSGTQPYVLAVAWATMANKYPGIQIQPEPAVGAPQAVVGFLQGQLDMCYVSSNIFGNESPKYIGGKTLAQGPKHLLAARATAVHIVTHANSGINSIADFKGKKILAKVAQGGAVDATRKAIFAEYGMTDDDIVLLSGNNGSHLAEQLKEGVGDAAMIFLGLRDASLVDLCTTKNIKWIDLPNDKMEAVGEKTWLIAGTIPAGTYPKQDANVMALQSAGSFDVRADMPEDLAYELVKVYHDHHDEIVPMAVWAKSYDMKAAMTSGYLPFHTGAIKYYKEKGAWTGEVEAKNKRVSEKVIQAGK